MRARPFFEMAGLSARQEIVEKAVLVNQLQAEVSFSLRELEALEARVQYVRALHNTFGLSWEARSSKKRPGVTMQLVTPVMTQKEADESLLRIRELDNNLGAYKIFPSSTGQGFRVVCTLSDLKDFAPKGLSVREKETILSFLNAIHLPSKALTAKTWKLDNECISFVGPSLGYVGEAGLAGKIYDFLKTNINDEAVDAGFDRALQERFKLVLVAEDHKAGCFYYLPMSGFLLYELYPAAKAYQDELRSQDDKTPAAVFSL